MSERKGKKVNLVTFIILGVIIFVVLAWLFIPIVMAGPLFTP